MGTGLVLMAIMEALGVARWGARLDTRWMGAYYGVVLLMPVGMLGAAGIWGPVVAAGAALLLPWAAYFARQRLGKPMGETAMMKEQVTG
jgi:hypothetical protein